MSSNIFRTRNLYFYTKNGVIAWVGLFFPLSRPFSVLFLLYPSLLLYPEFELHNIQTAAQRCKLFDWRKSPSASFRVYIKAKIGRFAIKLRLHFSPGLTLCFFGFICMRRYNNKVNV